MKELDKILTSKNTIGETEIVVPTEEGEVELTIAKAPKKPGIFSGKKK